MDVGISNEEISHYLDVPEFLREVSRVPAPGRSLIIACSYSASSRSRRRAVYDFCLGAVRDWVPATGQTRHRQRQATMPCSASRSCTRGSRTSQGHRGGNLHSEPRHDARADHGGSQRVRGVRRHAGPLWLRRASSGPGGPGAQASHGPAGARKTDPGTRPRITSVRRLGRRGRPDLRAPREQRTASGSPESACPRTSISA